MSNDKRRFNPLAGFCRGPSLMGYRPAVSLLLGLLLACPGAAVYADDIQYGQFEVTFAAHANPDTRYFRKAISFLDQRE